MTLAAQSVPVLGDYSISNGAQRQQQQLLKTQGRVQQLAANGAAGAVRQPACVGAPVPLPCPAQHQMGPSKNADLTMQPHATPEGEPQAQDLAAAARHTHSCGNAGMHWRSCGTLECAECSSYNTGATLRLPSATGHRTAVPHPNDVVHQSNLTTCACPPAATWHTGNLQSGAGCCADR